MLLDVCGTEATGSIKLLWVDLSARYQYLALSYCWGCDGQRKVLSASTMDEFLAAGIKLQDLDATIQDAVLVTRELSYRYLWIDALCIPQDDARAKAHEITRMGAIYQNATFTIVAARASSVKEGFLFPRQPVGANAADYVFKIAYGPAADDLSAILVPMETEDDRVPLEPWNTRGWTLQEQVFSARQLRFGSKQTSWICARAKDVHEDFDGWFRADLKYFRRYPTMNNSHLARVGQLIRRTGSSSSTFEGRSAWYDLVEVYSNRALTYRQDRLPAISSIAQQMSLVLVDEYWCGHWKSSLPWELFWHRPYSSPEDQRGSLVCAPKKEKVRPSWSWASYDGAIVFEDRRDYGHFEVDPSFEVLEYVGDHASAVLQGGALMAGRLRIRGLVTPAPFELHECHHENTWTMKPENVDINRQQRPGDLRQHSLSNLRSMFLDKGLVCLDDGPHRMSADPQRTVAKESIFLLILGYAKSELMDVMGLVLLQEEDGHSFSRIGVFYISRVYRGEPDKHGLANLSWPERRNAMRAYWGGLEGNKELQLV